MKLDEVMALDAGIRNLVLALRREGWDTTDSGDGVSKPPEQRVFETRHVVIAVEPHEMLTEADRLQAWLLQRGERMQVEATYWPASGQAVLLATEDPT